MFQCKNCGRNLDAELDNARNGVVICPACMSRWPVPAAATPTEAKILLSQGELFLDTCHFDEAKTAYEKAAKLAPEEAEAYFGMALAAFKVQYLKDEEKKRLQPICYKFTQSVFSEDKNYLRALELASEEKKQVYRAKAQEIDAIREEFCRLKQEGVNYDCFLCVKVGDNHGGNTQDNTDASNLNSYLTTRGYHTFYSEVDARGRVGEAYEAIILYALYTSKCMLVICSNKAYLETDWMKNEYMRFAKMIADEDKERDAIAIVFRGEVIEHLPGREGKLQGVDLARPDAYALIEEYIKKHTSGGKGPIGAKLYFCPKCGTPNDETEKKCTECGTSAAYFITREEFQRREAERKARAEAEAKAKAEAERKKREEIIAKPWLAPDYPTLENYDRDEFEIEGTSLIKYNGYESIVEIPKGVTSIGHYAFRDCSGLTSITIPDSVTSIGDWAFNRCSRLTSITIPDSVTSIGLGAFIGTAYYNDTSHWDSSGVLYIGNHVIGAKDTISGSYTIRTGTKKIADYAFSGCRGLTSIIIPDSVTSIGGAAFYICSGLTSITIPDSVTSIGGGAFSDCSGLTSVTIPNSVTKIGGSAFMGCTSLTNITIPDSVTSIGYWAFQGCSGLTSITIPDSVTSIGNEAFWGCNKLKKVTIPKRFKDDNGTGLEQIFGDNYKKIKFKFI